MTLPHRIAAPIALLLVAGAIAGCVGSDEPAGANLPAETDLSFSSFDEARSADGPTYGPDGLGWSESDTQSGTATGTDYAESHAIPVAAAASQSINVTVSLNSPSPADELTFVLLDDAGTEQASVTLGADTTEGTLAAEGPGTAGNWSVDVSGQAVQTSYSVDHTIHYEGSSPYKLKVLEPLESITPGDAAFVFLLYNADAGEPITDANLTLESWMTEMGHGTNNAESDPVHDANGVYVGKISPEMAGDWVVRIDYSPGSGEDLRFAPPVEVVEG